MPTLAQVAYVSEQARYNDQISCLVSKMQNPPDLLTVPVKPLRLFPSPLRGIHFWSNFGIHFLHGITVADHDVV